MKVFRCLFLFLSFLLIVSFVDTSKIDNSQEINFACGIIREKLGNSNVLSTEYLSGGDSGSRIFKIITPQNAYVAKFVKPYNISFLEEEKSARILSDNGIGPKLYYSDQKNDLLIMSYIKPDPITISFRKSNDLYLKLSQILEKIHSIPIDPSIAKKNIFDDIARDANKVLNKSIDEETRKIILKTLNYCNSKKTKINFEKKICHCELHPGNLIFHENNFFVIDSTISESDPYYDIATVAIFWCFNKNNEEILLKNYLKRELTSEDLEKLELFKNLVKFRYALGSLIDCSSSDKLSINLNINISLLDFLKSSQGIDSDEKKIQLASILLKSVNDSSKN
ncbi:MAG: phosphotransferase [Parachlamydiales bacterium]|jgi:thiamine kinase-like enzyme